MSWATPPTFTAGNVLTAAQKNIERDNFNETSPAKATGGGGIIMATALNQVVQRTPNSNFTSPVNSTTSTGYATFASGPAVSLTTGGIVWVFVTATMASSVAGQGARMNIGAIGGHNPTEENALIFTSAATTQAHRATCLIRIDGLTPGVNVFTPVYRSTDVGSTASFSNRRVDVLQLG